MEPSWPTCFNQSKIISMLRNSGCHQCFCHSQEEKLGHKSVISTSSHLTYCYHFCEWVVIPFDFKICILSEHMPALDLSPCRLLLDLLSPRGLTLQNHQAGHLLAHRPDPGCALKRKQFDRSNSQSGTNS